jgi:hypothetical protein
MKTQDLSIVKTLGIVAGKNPGIVVGKHLIQGVMILKIGPIKVPKRMKPLIPSQKIERVKDK